MSDLVIEHGESSRARRLRRDRLRIALALAAVEGIFVLAGAIPWWVVVVLAAAAVAFYTIVRHQERSELVQPAWIAAFSQAALVLVPLVAAVVAVLAVLVIVLLVLVALITVARGRR